MYDIFTYVTYIWLISLINVRKYTIHGSYGYAGNFHAQVKLGSFAQVGVEKKEYSDHHLAWICLKVIVYFLPWDSSPLNHHLREYV